MNIAPFFFFAQQIHDASLLVTTPIRYILHQALALYQSTTRSQHSAVIPGWQPTTLYWVLYLTVPGYVVYHHLNDISGSGGFQDSSEMVGPIPSLHILKIPRSCLV